MVAQDLNQRFESCNNELGYFCYRIEAISPKDRKTEEDAKQFEQLRKEIDYVKYVLYMYVFWTKMQSSMFFNSITCKQHFLHCETLGEKCKVLINHVSTVETRVYPLPHLRRQCLQNSHCLKSCVKMMWLILKLSHLEDHCDVILREFRLWGVILPDFCDGVSFARSTFKIVAANGIAGHLYTNLTKKNNILKILVY